MQSAKDPRRRPSAVRNLYVFEGIEGYLIKEKPVEKSRGGRDDKDVGVSARQRFRPEKTRTRREKSKLMIR